MIFSESNTKIAPALAKAWGELENPKHNTTVKVRVPKKNVEYSFDYTDLGGIFDAVKGVFKDNGITIMQNASTKEMNGYLMICVDTMLLHSSGEWVKSEPLQMPSSTNMQDMGGQITYMKRYSLSALLGIATEKDDDANGASGNDYQMQPKKASDKQLGLINNLIKTTAKKYELTEQQLYEGVKKRLNFENDMENWTSQQASKFISEIKKGDKS